MDKLIQKIQASRNVADPTLYGGALQDNTDIYYKANKLYSQDDVPEPPAKIFRNYGATTELDNRPFMSLGLQAPRNPEQEALNEYFNRKRIAGFAEAQSRMDVGGQISKQAELMANNFVQDEIDRRAGIRRTVLEATGYTPAQIQQELAANALAGVNQNALDIRDRQVQDAVNLYYSLNNIPIPITTPSGIQTAVAATVPSEVAAQLPMDDAEAIAATDAAAVDGEEPPMFIFGGPSAGAGAAAAAGDETQYDGMGGAANVAAPLPDEVRGIAVGDQGPLPDVSEEVRRMSTDDLLDYVVRNNIPQEGLIRNKDGSIKARVSKQALIAAVTDHMSQARRLSILNKQGNGGGK